MMVDTIESGRAEFNFSVALGLIKQGQKLSRTGWNGKGLWISMQTPDANSKMGLPYLYISTVDGRLVPWIASQADVFAEDWSVV